MKRKSNINQRQLLSFLLKTKRIRFNKNNKEEEFVKCNGFEWSDLSPLPKKEKHWSNKKEMKEYKKNAGKKYN